MSYRAGRLAETIKKEISNILRDEIKDPRIGFVTVTDVEVSLDLRNAKIYFSVLGDKDKRKGTIDVLNKANGFIRSELGRRIRLRFTPELLFKIDESLDHGIKIMEILEEVKEEGKVVNKRSAEDE